METLFSQVGINTESWVDWKTLLVMIVPIITLVIGYFYRSSESSKSETQEQKDKQQNNRIEDIVKHQEKLEKSLDSKLDSILNRLSQIHDRLLKSEMKHDATSSKVEGQAVKLEEIEKDLQDVKKQVALLEQKAG